MPSSRDQIKLTDAELSEFLDAPHTVSVASNGADGWPHVVALWYVMRDGEPWIWTYGKSQKIKNLERDSHATLMVEDGERYDELRGAMIKAEAEIVRDYGEILTIGMNVYEKYNPALTTEVWEAIEQMIGEQSRKRVAVRFKPVETSSWDHRKL